VISNGSGLWFTMSLKGLFRRADITFSRLLFSMNNRAADEGILGRVTRSTHD